eukprot:CAMPEP_0185163704 /NCGR_PEP_ID=MMETSP1139-20130426/8366_1 /TAXON_ID=298111 /ORGANISM="Pavlova sp., Strain CCMP459" /LENGTH=46 /DNA_ID= /DNA_START= /DNA_END= /DNA_ORIENTATION=
MAASRPRTKAIGPSVRIIWVKQRQMDEPYREPSTSACSRDLMTSTQ